MTLRMGSPALILLAIALAVTLPAMSASGQASPGAGPMTTQTFSTSTFTGRTLNSIAANCNELANQSSPFTSDESDLFVQCTDIVNASNSADQDNAALATIDDENPGVGTNATEASVAQLQTLRDRMYALREGSSGIQIAGFGLGTLRNPLAEDSASGSDADIPGFGAFFNGVGFFGDQDQRGEQAPYDFHGGGVTAGVDYRFREDLIAGFAFGYTGRNSDFDNGSDFESDSYSPSIYATWFGEQFYVDGIFTWTHTNHDLQREIAYNVGAGPVIRTAESTPSANEYAVSVGGGYEFTFGELSLGPRAQVNYLYWDLDSFNEKGAGGLNLMNGSQDLTSLTTVVGGDAAYAISTGIGIIMPQIRAGWVHEFENDSRRINAVFAAETFAPMDVFTSSPDRDYVALGATVSGTFAHGWSAFIDYETLLGLSDVNINTFTVGARVEF